MTPAQKRYFHLAKTVCKANKIAASTLKHRALDGTKSLVSGTGNVKVTASPAPNVGLEATTDYQVWAVFEEVMIRSGSSDGGDTSAGRAWIGRLRGQVPFVDITGAAIMIADQDWLQTPDNLLYEIENPVISEDGARWVFSLVTQR